MDNKQFTSELQEFLHTNTEVYLDRKTGFAYLVVGEEGDLEEGTYTIRLALFGNLLIQRDVSLSKETFGKEWVVAFLPTSSLRYTRTDD